MGCGASKNHLDTVDDSVHVMLQHDKKVAQKHGQQLTGYVPRAEHPLLHPKNDEPETSQPSQPTVAEEE